MSLPTFPSLFVPNAVCSLQNVAPAGGGAVINDVPIQVIRPYIAFEPDQLVTTTANLLPPGSLLIRFFIQTDHPIAVYPRVADNLVWTLFGFEAVLDRRISDGFKWASNNTNPDPIWYCIGSWDWQP